MALDLDYRRKDNNQGGGYSISIYSSNKIVWSNVLMIVFTFNGILETESAVLHHGQNDTRRQRFQGGHLCQSSGGSHKHK